MVLRPALPDWPSVGGANAAGVKKPGPSVTLRPVAFALRAPKLPLPPESERLPSTRAVYGSPLNAVMLPARIQERSIPFSVGLAIGRFLPTGDCSVKPMLRLCR